MNTHTIALFGAAEKGALNTLYYIRDLGQLNQTVGNPMEESYGVSLAIQMLLYSREIIYIRVNEEGYSLKDYFVGLKMLEEDKNIPKLAAIALPGVGDPQILNEFSLTCMEKKWLMLTKEADLYDYMTTHQIREAS